MRGDQQWVVIVDDVIGVPLIGLNDWNGFLVIPHDFGLGQPPLLDNVELIKSKCEMIDNLLEIEIAYSMLDESNNNVEGDEHPIDGHFNFL